VVGQGAKKFWPGMSYKQKMGELYFHPFQEKKPVTKSQFSGAQSQQPEDLGGRSGQAFFQVGRGGGKRGEHNG